MSGDRTLVSTASPGLPDRHLDLGPRYEDRGEIGQGAMGYVHRAFDRKLGRVVAIKVLRAEHARSRQAVARFLDEAQAAAQLEHPCIIPIYDVGELADGRPFFTMREVGGRDLNAAIQDAHKWIAETSPDRPVAALVELLEIFRRVCEAVGYAHRRGVIHRDLKPGNVLLGDAGEVWVVDWGLAKVVRDGEVALTGRSKSLRTMTGTLMGTPTYMPPEQAAGRVHDLDARSDVYALGAILYTLLACRRPYDTKGTWVAVVAAVLQGPPAPLREVARFALPDPLVDCCEKAMQRERADRYPTAVEIAAAIGAWLTSA